MICPKCEHDLEVVSYNDIEVDRCTNCFGIWFDHREQDELKKLQGAESIDIGDEFVGEFSDYLAEEIFDEFQQVMHDLDSLESGQNLVDN